MKTAINFNRIETCNFSGFKIYPGHGSLYVRVDSRVYRFVNSKNKSLFLQRKKPAKFDWTIVFRRLHKKGIDETATKKRSKKTVKVQRSVVGASLDVIKAKREQTAEARLSERKKAIDAVKEKKKAAQQKKAAEKKVHQKNAQPKVSKQQAKGFAPKAAATSR
ncbi:60S ribosomal protein L24 [Boothiomyces macroporosus]|uniref:60S ribosomal protein L24 n=1 Tax=Boothiomyces macroporosus TaxID=261099 RepID=A0AAD5Y3V5_9FUNG|nr:60S ribosomal protein L24 [Boothiomyces macroporosus]